MTLGEVGDGKDIFGRTPRLRVSIPFVCSRYCSLCCYSCLTLFPFLSAFFPLFFRFAIKLTLLCSLLHLPSFCRLSIPFLFALPAPLGPPSRSRPRLARRSDRSPTAPLAGGGEQALGINAYSIKRPGSLAHPLAINADHPHLHHHHHLRDPRFLSPFPGIPIYQQPDHAFTPSPSSFFTYQFRFHILEAPNSCLGLYRNRRVIFPSSASHNLPGPIAH